jgi:hypothetical protein
MNNEFDRNNLQSPDQQQGINHENTQADQNTGENDTSELEEVKSTNLENTGTRRQEGEEGRVDPDISGEVSGETDSERASRNEEEQRRGGNSSI